MKSLAGLLGLLLTILPMPLVEAAVEAPAPGGCASFTLGGYAYSSDLVITRFVSANGSGCVYEGLFVKAVIGGCTTNPVRCNYAGFGTLA